MIFHPQRVFHHREEAGHRLAALLGKFAHPRDTLILALPRGGVPVAAEIATALNQPFDVLVVRKLGTPGQEELAMGAIAGGGVRILNHDLIARCRLSQAEVDAVIQRETAELARRESLYRGSRPPPAVAGRTVILVDDGIATGATMSAAIELLRHQQVAHLVVAVPVAPPDTVKRLRREADEVVTVLEPEPFIAVGRWYEDFSQTSDAQVHALLAADCPPHDPGREPPAAARAAGTHNDLARLIRREARPLTGAADDFDGVLAMIGDASLVLLGAATHGTHEFYRQRAQLTKRLIVEQGFTAVAAEAAWPDAYRVNRLVRGEPGDLDSVESLAGFERFPSWLWRNAEVLDFVGWLRNHNENVSAIAQQAGFYGLDLYSLHQSMNEVIAYLERRDPAAAGNAKMLYGCIDRFGRDPQNYGLLAGTGVSDGCRAEVIQQLAKLRAKEVESLTRNGRAAADGFFFAEQNARLVKNAESYYRKMFRSYASSWNLRDEHMMETLMALIAHLQSSYGTAKVVVWAHNSHLGDARATEMSWRGELNLGQLVREAFPNQCRLIGFTTYTGTVTAAAGWHLAAERSPLRPGLDGSCEKLFHQVGIPNFWLDLTRGQPAAGELKQPLLERAIGVLYMPGSERRHYFKACLAEQFDAVIHYDLTRAVEPIEPAPAWNTGRRSATFPAGW